MFGLKESGDWADRKVVHLALHMSLQRVTHIQIGVITCMIFYQIKLMQLLDYMNLVSHVL